MKAITDYPVNDLIASRWSPYCFANRSVSDEDLRSLFEAARWAASSYNEQPWSYIVAKKEDADEFGRLLSCLVEANQAWAKAASALALGISRLNFARNNKPIALLFMTLVWPQVILCWRRPHAVLPSIK
jgi:nitroreductase